MLPFLSLLLAAASAAAQYSAPAGIRPAVRRPGAASILPGGRVIASLGRQYMTGPGPFGLALSPNGRTLVSSNGGPDRYSLTVLEKGRGRHVDVPPPGGPEAGKGRPRGR